MQTIIGINGNYVCHILQINDAFICGCLKISLVQLLESLSHLPGDIVCVEMFLTAIINLVFFNIIIICPDLTSEERQLLLDIRRRKAELLQVGFRCFGSYNKGSALRKSLN